MSVRYASPGHPMTSGQLLALSAVIVVCVAVALIVWRSRQPHHATVTVARPAASPTTGTSPSGDFPPKPKWKPTVPVDIERTIATFAHYTDRKRVFVVFEHGTCVVVPEASREPEAEAKQLLDRVYNYHPDFN